jgi:hypothetical protein
MRCAKQPPCKPIAGNRAPLTAGRLKAAPRAPAQCLVGPSTVAGGVEFNIFVRLKVRPEPGTLNSLRRDAGSHG